MAERRLYRLDPEPDLDNANVGKKREPRVCPFGIPIFFARGNMAAGQTGPLRDFRHRAAVRSAVPALPIFISSRLGAPLSAASEQYP